uniref:G-protein coupled receptor 22 n=1 Tax=Oryzias latipes TaxID=8090 RepID=A0A3P9MLK2_ORYLA
MGNMTEFDTNDPFNSDAATSETIKPNTFQVSLAGFLILEIVLGLSSNLTVLVLYCLQQNLVSSVSNIITMNLHVLDMLVCICCIPLTVVMILLPLEVGKDTICCFHEACVSFASVATAANVLAITVDRYDISVRPANRVLTIGRAVALLGIIWALSFFSFLVPFMEVGFFVGSRVNLQNQTVVVAVNHPNKYYTGLYYHLLAQIPIFFFTAMAMLVTYYKILRALNIRIGTHFQHNLGKKKKKSKNAVPLSTASQADPTVCGSTGVRAEASAPLGMQTSVSVIIALRRAMRRHHERRERQRRVFRMALLIISTFLLCWTPITLLNIFILSTGPSDLSSHLRLAFLVMAYGTTIFHPLLYAFTRQKLQKVLKSKMKRVVSADEEEHGAVNLVMSDARTKTRRHKKSTSKTQRPGAQDAE